MRNLLLAIFVLAAALAVLQWNSAVLTSAAFSLFLAMLALGLTGAICRQGPARAFWIGFTIFAWFYGGAVFPTSTGATPGGWLLGIVPQSVYRGPVTSPVLLTDLAFDYASLTSQLRVGNRVMAQWQSGGYYEATITQVNGAQYLAQWTDGSTPSWVTRNQIQLLNLAGRQAAHSIMAIFIGVVGGALAEIFFARDERRDHEQQQSV